MNRDDDDNDVSFPLRWPTGWIRTPPGERRQALFGTREDDGALRPLTISEGRDRLLDELDRLGADDVVISSDLRPRSVSRRDNGRAELLDPGVAVYFVLGDRTGAARSVLASDRWDRIADNLAALAGHIEAIRRQQRYGVGSVAQAFAGYKALPQIRAWWEILGVSPHAMPDEIKARKRELLQRHHPDRGGDPGQAAEITAAFAEAIKAGAVR
jgi:DnaJ domain